MLDLFEEVMGFEILGGFDDDLEKADLLQRAEELGLDADDYDTLEKFENAIEELK